MAKKPLLAALLLIASLVITVIAPSTADAAFNKNLLIDDVVFSDTTSMSAAQINAFLNRFPSSCISTNSGFQAREPSGYSPSGGYTYGSFASAGQVIWRSAVTYGVNPRVLLTTLQKEQGLVSGNSTICGQKSRYVGAMGFGCPDSGSTYSWTNVSLYRRNGVEQTSTGPTCVNSAAKAGFSQQMIRAAWLLKFGQQRSRGNVDWAVINGSWNNSDDPPTCYGGPMTQGTFKRCQNGSATYYDGYITIDGTATHMDTGATAALYWYTPHLHGNQVFVSLFESWFGSTISAGYYSCKDTTNLSGVPNGGRALINQYYVTGYDQITLAMQNSTSSACIEAHTWNGPLTGWINNVATNHGSANPADGEVITGNLYGDNKDELIYVHYRNTGSGRIEIHTWDRTYQKWLSNTATNHHAVDPANARVIAADLDADGKDELHFIKYQATGSGRVEVHTWRAGQQSWVRNIATQHPASSLTNVRIIGADQNFNGRDELLLVVYRGTGSGRVEVHTWNFPLNGWQRNVATNHPAVDPADAEVIAGNRFGNGADDLIFVKYRATGSNKIEVHTWRPGQQFWLSNVATNHPSI